MIAASLLCSCSPQRERATLRVGMPWQETLSVMRDAGWTDTFTLFELEKTFVDRGGRMYAWAHPGGSVIYFSTLPNGSVEVLTEMNPSDGDTAGAEAQILEMLAESVAPRPAHTRFHEGLGADGRNVRALT